MGPGGASDAPSARGVDVLDFLRPRVGLDDFRLADILSQGESNSSKARYVDAIDLADNYLTDDGIAALVTFLKQKSLRCKELRLNGNCLSSPIAIAELLRDERVGISAGLRLLHLTAGSLSHESMWRILEACFLAKPCR